jgi:LysR family transcriptional regulator for bpeEF and oprC
MENLNTLNLFVAVGEMKSFSHAAERLGMTVSGVSKGIQRLELELKVRLVNRTTRRVGLTPEGEQFFERCHAILADIKDAEFAVVHSRSQPTGKLRVLLSVGFGRHVVVPLLAKFAERYQDVVIDVELSDRVADFSSGQLDVAVVGSDHIDPRLIARELCSVQYLVCASPDYVRRHGAPASPDELRNHRCIAHLLPQTGRYRNWVFAGHGNEVYKAVGGNLNFNNAESALAAAITGQGIAVLGSFVVSDAIAAGKLQVLLVNHEIVRPCVSIIYPQTGIIAERVRLFVDFLRSSIPRNLTLENCRPSILA